MSIKEIQLAELAAQLEKCSSCHLRGDCQAPVGWYGCPDSPIIFIGEGPGGVEDDYGCPLIGPSGQLLDKALWSVQMTRDRVLTSNIVKCRPKGNRTPDLSEADYCAKIWLERELAILQPKVIVALGSVANGSKPLRVTTVSLPSILLTFCGSMVTPRSRPSGTCTTTCSWPGPKRWKPARITISVPINR